MFSNYLKIALRNLWRNKIYSLINISGLAIGMAAIILILLYIKNEISFDRFHENKDLIYRVNLVSDRPEYMEISSIATAGIGPAMLEDLPEVEQVVRFSHPRAGHYFTHNERNYYLSNVTYTDSSIFDLFSFRLISGNPHHALKEPYSVVLTEKAVKRIFGEADPINRVVKMNDRDLVKVTGVVEDPPPNSQLQFDALVSFTTLYEDPNMYLGFDGGHDYLTYIKIQDHTDIGQLEARFPDFMEKHINYKYREYGILLDLYLEPLTRAHLFSRSDYDLETKGSLREIFIYSAIAFFILIIACINFMNLSTAKSIQRAREIGLRRVVGSSRYQIIKQFLGEAVFMSFFSLILALLLVEIIQPVFNELTVNQLSLYHPSNLPYLPLLIIIAFMVGTFAGSYPAFHLSRFQPLKVLKGEFFTMGGRPMLRNILVILQFFISAVLIIITLVLFSQIRFITHKTLGFNKENIVVIPLKSEKAKLDYELLKSEFLKIPDVLKVGVSSEIPGSGLTQNGYTPEGLEDPIMIHALDVGIDYLSLIEVPVIKGSGFNLGVATDKTNYLVNETLVQKVGWDDPIGKTISRDGDHKVIGVVKDFHFAPMSQEIGPLLITMEPWLGYDYLSIKLSGKNNTDAIEKIESVWKEYIPNESFIYSFHDQIVTGAYDGIKKFKSIMLWFSLIAVFIACLGLLGLAMYSAQQKRREICIRKVLGADIRAIVFMLSFRFTRWIILANIISWPMAWYLSKRILEEFAYRTTISIWIFLFTLVISLLIGLTTIIFQSLRAAGTNPVEVLKYE